MVAAILATVAGPADVDGVPWARLRTSTGAGARLPALLADAADPGTDAAAAVHALTEIERIVGHCGMNSEAAAHLPRFLARIARRTEPAVREVALDLLETVAVASPASPEEAGDPWELAHVLRGELVACLPDLRAVPGWAAADLARQIESELVPGGVVADRWRSQARPWLKHIADRLFTVTLNGQLVLVTTGYNASSGIACWNPTTGEQLGSVPHGVARHAYAVADGPGLVIAGVDAWGQAHRWAMPSGAPLPDLRRPRSRLALRRSGKSPTLAMTTYRDGDNLIIVGGDEAGCVQRWNPATGEPQGGPVRIGNPVRALWTYETAGRTGIAVGDDNGQVWRWFPDADAKPEPVAGKHHQMVLYGTAYIEGDRTVLVSGATDQAVYRWDADTGEQLGEPWIMPDTVGGICSYVIDGRRIVAVGGRYQVQRFDALTGERYGDLIQGHQEPIVDTCFAEIDGRPILFTCDPYSVWRWDAVTGEPLPAAERAGSTGAG
jgi:hypothetical protein